MQKAVNFNNVAIVSDKGSDYRIGFWYMSKDVISIMNNSNLGEKVDCFFVFFFIIYINERVQLR